MLRLLHRYVFDVRGHAEKPRWAMRVEAAYWLCRGDVKLARLFWSG